MNFMVEIGLPVATITGAAMLLHDASAFIAERAFPPLIEGAGVVHHAVQTGETVLVDWTITKRTSCPGENARMWQGEDGFRATEPRQATNLPPFDGPRRYLIETEIPAIAPPGDLELRIVGHFQCVGGPRVNFELGPVHMEVVE